MKIKEIMTRDVEVVPQSASIREAAKIMKDHNIGSILVVDGKNVVGIVTDRDIILRSTAEGHDPENITVKDIMSKDLIYGYMDQDVEEAAHMMGAKQIRRLPVLDAQHQLIGIISLGDIATDQKKDELTGQTLEKISTPSKPKK